MKKTFFVRVDQNALVEETYWSNPISLAIPFSTSLKDLLAAEDIPVFECTLHQAMAHELQVICAPRLQGNQDALNIAVFLVSVHKKVLVLAIEESPLDAEEVTHVQKELIVRFLTFIGKMHQKEGNPITSNNFEQIQLLNNELVNAQRKLQKANIQLKHLNEELNNRLVKGPLTSLVSRYQYRSEIDRTISLQPKMLGLFAFIDIDDFKHINDTLGHAAGDQYLMEFARRLQSLDFGMATICMRIAGDEFGLYLHGFEQIEEDFLTAFWDIFTTKVMEVPIQIESTQVPISCSVGLSVFGTDTKNVFELIEYADFAMYQAKRKGKRSYCLFDHTCYQKEKLSHYP